MNWTSPNNGGFNITEYRISIAGNDSTFNSDNLGCGQDPRSLSCIIPSTTLQEAPFFLSIGDLINMTASAKNQIGWGDSLTVNANSNRVHRPPSLMAKPGFNLAENSTKIDLLWPPVKGIEVDGTPVLGYEVAWDGGEENISEQDFAVFNETQSNNYSIAGVNTCQNYRFRVR